MVVPILRATVGARRYRLAEEVASDVHGEDLGLIDHVRLRNDSGSRVLVRSGGLLEGSETQSRGITASVVLEPRSTADVEVRCVHASRSIAPGALLEFARVVAPDSVHRALLSRDQGLVWASILRSFGPSRSPVPPAYASPGPQAESDDLLATLAVWSATEDAADDFVRRIPTHEMQCGVLLVDVRGVVAVEAFDHPDSWRVASLAILKRHASLLRPARASPMKATADSDAAVGMAKGFLGGLAQSRVLRATADSWIVDRPLAACAAIDGEVIHLVAFRPEEAEDQPSATLGVLGRGGLPAAVEAHAPDAAIVTAPQGPAALEPDTAEVSAVAMVDSVDDIVPASSLIRPRRRKVLTSGWDAETYLALEHFSHKELQGDRSAAIRFLVRKGLRGRGYMGPSRHPEPAPIDVATMPVEAERPAADAGRARMEMRIQDLERVAETVEYAGWLRKRARLELERMATGEEEAFRVAARFALDRLTSMPPEEEPSLPPTEEVPPVAPSVDVRALLRRAFAASAGGDYPETLALFDEVLGAEPGNRTALLGKAIAFRRAGKTQEALETLDLVLQQEPKNAAALLNRGRLLQEKGDLSGALDAFDRLVAVAPNDWDVWMVRGDVLVRIGRDEEALRSYAEALRRNPDDEQLRGRIRAVERARVAPVPRGPRRVAMPQGVEEGQSYLVKEMRPELSYRTFKAILGLGIPSLLITRQPRERVQRQHGLEGVRILALSHRPAEDVYSPVALTSLSRTIERFVEDNRGRGVILLDGLDVLAANNGLRDTLLFVEHVNEVILQSKAVLLVSLTPEALPDKEAALLERSFRTLS